jgi:hypothetical protein
MKVIPKGRRLHCKKCVKMDAQFIRHIHEVKQRLTPEAFNDYKEGLFEYNLLFFRKGLTASFLLRMADLYERDLDAVLKELKHRIREHVVMYLNRGSN